MKVLSLKRILLMILMGFLPSLNEQVKASSLNHSSLMPTNLRCEYLIDPLGIGEVNPRLSWEMECGKGKSSLRGQKQTAFQVQVFSTQKLISKGIADLWDSGQVASEQSTQLEYQGNQLTSRMQCFWRVRVWDKDGKVTGWSKPASWTMGLLKPEDWSAKWISSVSKGEKLEFNDKGIPAPWFRKDFILDEAPNSASITVSSPCYFELYVNGIKVGDDVLTPAISDLQKQTFSVTYDVAKFLHSGKNCIGLWIGNGWSDVIVLRAQLDALVGDRLMSIGTDRSWKTRASCMSRIGKRVWNNYGGELIDAREFLPDWNLAGIDLGGWFDASEISPIATSCKNQSCPKNHIGERIPAVAITPLGEGRYEIDFGTNLTGWLQLHLPTLLRGQKVKLYFADRRFPDGIQATPIGNITINKLSIDSFPRTDGGINGYQIYNQISQFISAGNPGEVFQNKFNYAGFRYVVVEGLPSAPKKEEATALLIESDLESAGSFECSDEMLNRIHRLNRWTLRCLNLGGYMVDCPQRERMGYGGDGQTSLAGMMMNFNAASFYEKWAADWRQAQNENGSLPNIAPWGGGGGGPPWPGITAAMPWKHYLHYGNRRMLEENYQTAKRYAEFLDSRSSNELLHAWGNGFDFLGDWVPPGRGMDTNNWPNKEMTELVNNCYRVYLWQILADMAKVIERPADVTFAEDRIAKIRPVVHAAFFDPVNKYYVCDEQLYYLLPLMTGVTPESEHKVVLNNLVKCIVEKNQGHLNTGLIGTTLLMEFLQQVRRNDLILGIYQKKTYPGWGYMVEQGATTLWEQWNGHWSQIHSTFASADNWLYNGLAGIRPDPESPGFRKIIIKPALVGNITWVKAHHDSNYGRIVSNWKQEGDKITMDIAIPANTTATVYIPASKFEDVSESGMPARQAEGVEFLRMEGADAVFKIQSGQFHFQSTKKPSQL